MTHRQKLDRVRQLKKMMKANPDKFLDDLAGRMAAPGSKFLKALAGRRFSSHPAEEIKIIEALDK
jgi:hypothetical protein